MRETIKNYELQSNLTIEKLKMSGFLEGGFLKRVPQPKYFINKPLVNSILLHIEIVVNPDQTLSFDDFNNIIVLDDDFCQPYTPFYDESVDSNFLNSVIIRYNKIMDDFVRKGIFFNKEQICENSRSRNKEKIKH